MTGVSNGATYFYNAVPAAGCQTTDALSGVAVPATISITGGNGQGYGNYTATCSGAMDKAGNAAAPVSATYIVNGPTSLGGSMGLKSGPSNARVWQFVIGNNGPGTAFNTQIATLALHETRGAACTPVFVSAVPVSAGSIDAQATATAAVTIDFTGCGSTAMFTVSATLSANAGGATGSIVKLNQLP